MAQLPWLDRMLMTVSPGLVERRERARARVAALQRARNFYDGASRGRRTDGWRAPGTGPNSEIRGDLYWLRNRSRDLVRNSPWAARGIQVLTSNVVGYGIGYEVKHPVESVQAGLRDLAARHLGTAAIDSFGQHDICGLQRLAMRTIAEGGEVLLRKRRRRVTDRFPLPFQVEILEGDFLDHSKEGPVKDGYVVQGIEFDAIGRRTAYWLYDEHPGEPGISRMRPDSRRVPASDILHVYRVDRPGQARGVPWLSPAIITLRDLADAEDARLLQQKIAAAFAVFETTLDADIDVSNATTPSLESIEPGMYERLPPGRDIKFPNPPSAEGFADYVKMHQRKIAAALGITYEALTGDLSGVNFSSGRMGWLEMARNIAEWQWQMLIPRMCQGVERWFLEHASTQPQIGPAALQAAFAWTPPAREMIDPTKEIAALRDAVRAGLKTPSEAIREQGYDPEKFFAEFAGDMKRLDDLELHLELDPRRAVGSGDPELMAPPVPPMTEETPDGD